MRISQTSLGHWAQFDQCQGHHKAELFSFTAVQTVWFDLAGKVKLPLDVQHIAINKIIIVTFK